MFNISSGMSRLFGYEGRCDAIDMLNGEVRTYSRLSRRSLLVGLEC